MNHSQPPRGSEQTQARAPTQGGDMAGPPEDIGAIRRRRGMESKHGGRSGRWVMPDARAAGPSVLSRLDGLTPTEQAVAASGGSA